jgi:hypothetical protein
MIKIIPGWNYLLLKYWLLGLKNKYLNYFNKIKFSSLHSPHPYKETVSRDFGVLFDLIEKI